MIIIVCNVFGAQISAYYCIIYKLNNGKYWKNICFKLDTLDLYFMLMEIAKELRQVFEQNSVNDISICLIDVNKLDIKKLF